LSVWSCIFWGAKLLRLVATAFGVSAGRVLVWLSYYLNSSGWWLPLLGPSAIWCLNFVNNTSALRVTRGSTSVRTKLETSP